MKVCLFCVDSFALVHPGMFQQELGIVCRVQMHCLPKAVKEWYSAQGGLLGADKKRPVHHISLWVRRWFNGEWRVERLDSGHSTFKNCAAVNAWVPLECTAPQRNDLEKQFPFWESGCQTITLWFQRWH